MFLSMSGIQEIRNLKPMKEPTLKFRMATPPVYALLGVAWLAVSGFAQQGGRGPGFGPPGPPPKLTKIKDNLYVVENQAAKMSDLVAYGGNLTIYLTDQGAVLVEASLNVTTTMSGPRLNQSRIGP
jgi:hypothetical protein